MLDARPGIWRMSPIRAPVRASQRSSRVEGSVLGRLGRQHAGVRRELTPRTVSQRGSPGSRRVTERKARPSASSTKPPCAPSPAIARRCPSGLNASDSIAAIGAVWYELPDPPSRPGVEERDGAVEIAYGERVAVWMERGRGEAVTVTSHHADGGRIAAEDVQQAVARAGCVVEGDALPRQQQRPIQGRLVQRLRTESLRDGRRGLPAGAVAALQREHGRRDRHDEEPDHARRTRRVHDAGPARSRLGSRRGNAARPRRAPARAPIATRGPTRDEPRGTGPRDRVPLAPAARRLGQLAMQMTALGVLLEPVRAAAAIRGAAPRARPRRPRRSR